MPPQRSVGRRHPLYSTVEFSLSLCRESMNLEPHVFAPIQGLDEVVIGDEGHFATKSMIKSIVWPEGAKASDRLVIRLVGGSEDHCDCLTRGQQRRGSAVLLADHCIGTM